MEVRVGIGKWSCSLLTWSCFSSTSFHLFYYFFFPLFLPPFSIISPYHCQVYTLFLVLFLMLSFSNGISELGVMMMTTIFVTIILLLIWQINTIVAFYFPTFFLGVELLFFASDLGSLVDGSWVLLVFAAVLFMIVYIWN